MVTVHIPPMWRPHTGAKQVYVEASTIEELMLALIDCFPPLHEWILDEHGALAEWMNVLVNGQDIRLLDEMNTSVNSTDDIRIILAIGGG